MKKLRTILAVALVLCLMAGLMPMAAFADDARFDEIAAGQIPLSSDASGEPVPLSVADPQGIMLRCAVCVPGDPHETAGITSAQIA